MLETLDQGSILLAAEYSVGSHLSHEQRLHTACLTSTKQFLSQTVSRARRDKIRDHVEQSENIADS